MKYKIGDLVRIVNDGYYFEKGEIYTIKEICLSETIIFFDNWGVKPDSLEPVTHLTTKEFVKLVKGMGYEVDARIGVIFIKTKNFIDVGWVRTDGERCAAFNFECDKILLDIFYLYANTPLELREDKEQLYTLELPNNTNMYRFYNKKTRGYGFGSDNNDMEGYQTHFTQKEIDQLPNQELIKVLKQEPVK